MDRGRPVRFHEIVHVRSEAALALDKLATRSFPPVAVCCEGTGGEEEEELDEEDDTLL